MHASPAPRLFAALLALTVLGGCARYALVTPGPVVLDDCCTVRTSIAWSRLESGKREYWTVDGPRLHQLIILKGIAPGEALFTAAAGNPETPVYHTGLGDAALRVLLQDSLIYAGVEGVKRFTFKHERVGDRTGFRADFSFSAADGLARQGMMLGVERGKRLYLFFYFGENIEHFPRYLRAVEELAYSVSFIETSFWSRFTSPSSEVKGGSELRSDAPAALIGETPATTMGGEAVVIEHRQVVPP